MERLDKKEKKSIKKQKRKSYQRELIEQIKLNKTAFIVYCVCRTIVFLVGIRSIMLGQWESLMVCILASALLLLPPFVEKKIDIKLPTLLEVVVFLFVICAEILGEIECFYVKYSFWDTMLHTVNGFMFAAFGFCLVDIFNRNERFRFRLSAGFLALVAFCFSMTVGVLWEFAEYSIDHLAHVDMQKDTVVRDFASVTLDESNKNIPIRVSNIEKTIIVTSDGDEIAIEGGYLDIGIIDTVKDLFVNFVGAVVFSILGFIYVKNRGKGKIAAMLIPDVGSASDEYYGPEEMN